MFIFYQTNILEQKSTTSDKNFKQVGTESEQSDSFVFPHYLIPPIPLQRFGTKWTMISISHEQKMSKSLPPRCFYSFDSSSGYILQHSQNSSLISAPKSAAIKHSAQKGSVQATSVDFTTSEK
jgi:hypothetical protein